MFYLSDEIGIGFVPLMRAFGPTKSNDPLRIVRNIVLIRDDFLLIKVILDNEGDRFVSVKLI